MMSDIRISIVCCRCSVTRDCPQAKNGKPRTPKGWKLLGEAIYCPKCKGQAYMLRAVTLPIAAIVDGEWAEFRAALGTAWADVTACANWMTTELYARDIRRAAGVAKMPAMPKAYLYPEARAKFPAIGSQCVASLEQSVQAKYRSTRYEVIWTGGRTLANYRYPVPLPIPSQGWSLSRGPDGEMLLSIPLGGQRWTLRLRGGRDYARQTASLAKIIEGVGIGGEASVMRRTSFAGDKPKTEISVKIAAWLPKPPAKERSGTLIVKTDKDCFWMAFHLDGGKVWQLNGDHVVRASRRYARFRQRSSEDLKAERRSPTKKRRRFGQRIASQAEKHRNLLQSWCHEATRMLANLADRRGVSMVKYDDSEQGYLDSFPWFVTRSMLANKLDEFGIALEHASGDVTNKVP